MNIGDWVYITVNTLHGPAKRAAIVKRVLATMVEVKTQDGGYYTVLLNETVSIPDYGKSVPFPCAAIRK